MTSFTEVAKKHGGTKTWKFNQAKWSQWTKRVGTKEFWGICWACSVSYIVGEGNNNPLQPRVGSNGNINCKVYQTLCKFQAAHWNDQKGAQETHFANNGMAVSTIDMKSGAKANGDGPIGGEMAQSVCAWDNCFVMTTISPKKQGKMGHVVALKMKPNDYRLFDSNSGEYTFPNKTGFKQFVGQYFSVKYPSTWSYTHTKVT